MFGAYVSATSQLTYSSAKLIASALESGNEPAAFEELSQYAGTSDLQIVADKAIALGADPATIAMFLDSLRGEVIEVEGTAPAVFAPIVSAFKKPLPWKWIAMGAGAVAAIAIAAHTAKAMRKKKPMSPAMAGIGRLLWG
jgi:hypothetical protein